MSSTYSILNGELTESTRKIDIYSVLDNLPDNSQKLISPRDIRDAFLSTWSNSTFKLTSSDSNEYIGIDSNNPNNRDVKKKILLGKRSFGTLDIMSDDLINISDSDIFIYNTKSDSSSQDETKISFLAGTYSNLFTTAPFIKATKETSSISLSLENPQDSINILSNTNNVSLNNISFPTISENQSNAIDGKILKYVGVYPYGGLQWSDIEINDINIGQTVSSVNIYGSTVSVNGYPIEFIEDRLVPEKVGGIEQGMSFSAGTFNGQNWPLTEVIRELIYPFVEPSVNLEVTNLVSGNKYSEVGKTASVYFNYSITTYARDEDEQISQYFIRDNGDTNIGTWDIITPIGGPLTGTPGTIFSFTYSYDDFGNYTIGEKLDYGLLVSILNPPTSLSASTSTFGFDYTSVDSIEFLAPFMCGFSENSYTFSSIGITDIIQNSTLDRIIQPYPGDGGVIQKSLSTDIPAYIYFIHPYTSDEEVKQITDPSGYIIHNNNNISLSSFTFSGVVTPQSPLNYYGNYIIYRSNDKVIYNSGGKFEFLF